MSKLQELNMELASCADADPDTFFPEGKHSRTQVLAAKLICHDCPIKTECLTVALTEGYVGIWGETTDEERRQLRPIQITK